MATRSAKAALTTSSIACSGSRATDKRLVVVEDPAASDHLAPQRADAAARREFWDRLDALIRRARR